MTTVQRLALLISAVAAGICAGIYIAFSTFVMPALRRLPAEQGLVAMQRINVAAPKSVAFMGAQFLPLLLCAYLVITLVREPGPATKLVIAGAACFVIGCLVLMGYHVPHNDALAKVNPQAPGAADAWHDYYSPWVLWNHVRAVAFTASCACLALAMRYA